jgi:type IV pilus assembly protein PilB
MLISPSKKSLKEILSSNVSLGTIKELMTLDLVRPFASEEARLRESSQQIENLVERLEEQGRHMGDVLIERGLITRERWEELLTEMAETQTPLPTLLVKNRIIEPNALGEFADDLKREIEERTERGASIRKILLQEKLITEEQLAKAVEAAREEGTRVSQAVLSLGLVPFDKMAEIMKKHFEIDSITLGNMQIEFQVVNLVPDNLMKTHELLPFKRKGKKLHLAMTDPRNKTVAKKIEMMTRLEVIPHFVERKDLLRRLDEFVVAPPQSAVDRVKSVTGDESSFRALLDSDSAVKMVVRIIEGAFNTHATDIHVEPQEKGLRIRYRIDGMLYDIMNIPRDMGIPTVSRLKVLANMDVTERRRPQDGHISYDFDGHRQDLRAATLPTHLGEKMVLRVLDDTAVLQGLPHLGLEDESLATLKELIHRPHGMVLVTGPIGSGKTTTLYAALSEINHQTRNIVTLEDPVEYQLPGINQVQVDSKIGTTFASGLRSILRQDANILLVGEIRDPETAATAVRAANTGHLLFSSLHTNNAVSALTALQHLEVPRFQIATSLQGVVAQRLIRVLCPECKKQAAPKEIAKELLGLAKGQKIWEAKGCQACFGTGYQGRTGIYEVFKMTERLQEAVIHGTSEREIGRLAVEEGMITLDEAGKRKVLAGITSFEELSRVVVLQQD